ncbi:MAG TPA: DUF4129 domain-containing protein [Actinomycetota bacterium]|nr:DUF4129 domain-containing protein [Actinomycetota bacterium]
MRHRLPGAAAVACAALVAFPTAGWAAPRATSASDFVARLDHARRLAEADAAAPAPPKMQAVREALGLPLDVDLAGRTVHVPADSLLDGLRGTTTEDFRNADDHLAAMEDDARTALSAKPPDAARMAAALREALRGIRTEPSLFERLRHDIWVFIVSLWQRIARAVDRVPLPHGLVVTVAAGLLAVVVVILIRRLGYLVPERRAAGDGPGRQGKTDWDRLAREAMARGDLVEAVRARYGALLAALAGRGIVADTPSLTAGECRRAVAGGLPGAYPVVAKATTIFESVLYGRAEATASGVDTLAAAERSVKAA